MNEQVIRDGKQPPLQRGMRKDSTTETCPFDWQNPSVIQLVEPVNIPMTEVKGCSTLRLPKLFALQNYNAMFLLHFTQRGILSVNFYKKHHNSLYAQLSGGKQGKRSSPSFREHFSDDFVERYPQ